MIAKIITLTSKDWLEDKIKAISLKEQEDESGEEM